MVEQRAGDRDARARLRVRLATSLTIVTFYMLSVVAFLAAVFMHSSTLLRVGMFALAVSTAATTIAEGLRLSLALRLAQWLDLNLKPISRLERPMRFWTWTIINMAVFAIFAAAALFLGYIAICEPPSF